MTPSPDILKDFSRMQQEVHDLGQSNVRLANLLAEKEQENVRLMAKMTEAWKLVNAMAGQEHWDRAEAWLDENLEFKPEGILR